MMFAVKKAYLLSRYASQTSYYHWGSSVGIGRKGTEQMAILQILPELLDFSKVAIQIEEDRIHK